MARGMIRGMVAGLSVATLGLAVMSTVAPPPAGFPGPAPQAAIQGLQAVPAGLVAPRTGDLSVAAPTASVVPGRATLPLAPVPVVADAAPRRSLPATATPQAVAVAAAAPQPVTLAPLPPRLGAVSAGEIVAPAPIVLAALVLAAPGLPAKGVPALDPAPMPSMIAALPVRPVQPDPADRPQAMETAAQVPAVREDSVVARADADPALVLPGALADSPPETVEAPAPKPQVRRAGEVALAEAEPAPTIMRKPEPLVPAPGLGSAGAPQTEGALTEGAAPAAEAADAADQPPRVAFARPFDNPGQKPLMAFVLVDTGEPDLDRTALAALPFPVTFVLDPARPESALSASIYRAGGQEVAMLATAIPQGATASDIEVTFGAHANAMPEAVAVVVPETDGFQDNRPLATMVVPVVIGQGRGLLSWDRGLNAADQVARREGAHAATIFRRLDGKGEDVGRMRQYLDRAAFKAAQEGRVVVAGETRPDTVKALLEWAVEGRASSVALAPLSATLQSQ
jgi:polysaccharide deacetylase 2 family uncharacterized protein YibQ